MEQINIRSIQHFLYCPHRWGLNEIEKQWADNFLVARADLMHTRVHDSASSRTLRGTKTFCAVSVYNDDPEYGLYGITDCIEAHIDPGGIKLPGEAKRYQLCIVEYKPTMPKSELYHHSDLMQIFAQKLCVDHVFGCNCDTAVYYVDTKKRVTLPIQEQYDELDIELKSTLKQMRSALEDGTVPPIPKGQHCSGCSMKDICLPIRKQKAPFQKSILSILEEDT